MTTHEMHQLPAVLRPCQVKELLNISEPKYKQLIEAGTIRAIQLRGMKSRRFLKQEILAVLGIEEHFR